MADSLAAGDEVPEEDRIEQGIPVDDAETPDLTPRPVQSWDADEGDRLEQSIEVPDEDDHDRD